MTPEANHGKCLLEWSRWTKSHSGTSDTVVAGTWFKPVMLWVSVRNHHRQPNHIVRRDQMSLNGNQRQSVSLLILAHWKTVAQPYSTFCLEFTLEWALSARFSLWSLCYCYLLPDDHFPAWPGWDWSCHGKKLKQQQILFFYCFIVKALAVRKHFPQSCGLGFRKSLWYKKIMILILPFLGLCLNMFFFRGWMACFCSHCFAEDEAAVKFSCMCFVFHLGGCLSGDRHTYSKEGVIFFLLFLTLKVTIRKLKKNKVNRFLIKFEIKLKPKTLQCMCA